VPALSGTYKAWISTGNVDARQRLSHSTTPYALVDGTVVAKDWTQLTSGSLQHAIDQNESGRAPSVGTGCNSPAPAQLGSTSVPVWTNTFGNGTYDSSLLDCAEWSLDVPIQYIGAVWGDATQTDETWTKACVAFPTDAGPSPCSETAALYCIEQ
jgi:hypothetical protein